MLSGVRFFSTSWTVACQAPHGEFLPWHSPGKNTGVGCHFLIQEIFPTQGLNLVFLHCRQILYLLSHQGSPQNCVSHSVMSDSLRPHGTVAHQAPLSMGFSGQEYWSGLPFPSPGDLPNRGIKPRSPALQADALSSEPPGKPQRKYKHI